MHKHRLNRDNTTDIHLTVLAFTLFTALTLLISCGGGGDDTVTYVEPTKPACERNNTAEVKFKNGYTDITIYVRWDGARRVTIAPGDTSLPFTETAGVAHTLEFRNVTNGNLACKAGTPILTQCHSSLFTCPASN